MLAGELSPGILWAMKLVSFVLSLFAILGGSLLLLPLLAWASVQDPRLSGASYYAAVLAKLLGTWAVWAGVATVILGVAAGLHAILLAGGDRHERKEAWPNFRVGLLVGSMAVFSLLLFVNYLGLQAGAVGPISRWVWR
jgi:hypothetical protein